MGLILWHHAIITLYICTPTLFWDVKVAQGKKVSFKTLTAKKKNVRNEDT